jgi:hypothetical protein
VIKRDSPSVPGAAWELGFLLWTEACTRWRRHIRVLYAKDVAAFLFFLDADLALELAGFLR